MSSLRAEDAIFCDAIELPLAQRAEFVRTACAGDEALRASVEQLLQIHDTEETFLSTPASGMTGKFSEQPGELVGCYRLEKQLGEGGFGVVWQAKQLRPVQRTVALKIVKLGMDAEELMQRFGEERQTLAIMNHPHIATVFDAGVTQAGRPFVVMELVPGQAIDQFCFENDLSLRRTLTLFISVCRAVHHAHQKGIVHRDLKPSNILVSMNGTDLVPKIIDFGIALAPQDNSKKESSIQERRLLGTPLYMSPEQLLGGIDIDTRSDIYSLGVVLYRLLTGSGVDQPAFPSQPVVVPPSQKRAQNIRAGWPRDHRIHRPRESFGHDLDLITLKAMGRERDDRYESASEFAADIEKYLRCEPVLAGPPNRIYRIQKFVQRNRVGMVAATVVLFAIVCATLTAFIGWAYANRQTAIAHRQQEIAQQERKKADRQKRIALKEADEARRVAAVLQTVIDGANPITGTPSGQAIRQNLDEIAILLEQLSDHPEVEALLRTTIASAYHNLSQIEKAELQYRRARDLMLELGANRPKTLKYRINYALCLLRMGRLVEAETEIDVVLAANLDHPRQEVYFRAIVALARLRGQQERFAEAYKLSTECVELARDIHGPNHQMTLDLLSTSAERARYAGRLEDAEWAARESLERMIQAYPEKQVRVSNARFRLAGILVERGSLSEARELTHDVLEQQLQELDENDPHVIRSLSRLAEIERLDGDVKSAEQYARDAVQRAENRPKDRMLIRATAFSRLAQVLETNQPVEAIAAWEQAIVFRHQFYGDHPQVAAHLMSQAEVFQRVDRLPEAEANWQRAIAMLQRLEDKQKLISAYQSYANLLKRLGQLELSEDYLQKAKELENQPARH